MFFKKKKGKTPKTSNRKVVPNMKPIEELRTNKDVAEWCRDFLRITDELSPELAIADRAERNYLMALVGFLVEWCPRKDLSLESLAVLLSVDDARENDENSQSALDLMFVQIETGKAYRYVAEYHQYLWVPSKYRRNSDGMKPADRKELVGSEDFALFCWDSVNHLPAIRRISLKASLTSRLIDFKYLREAEPAAEAPAGTRWVPSDAPDYGFDDNDDDIPAFSFPEILKRKDDGKKGEHGGIGTTATRSSIIEGLKTRGYLEERKGKVRATDKAKAFYALLPPEIRGADVTARWWLIQQDIADGKADVNALQDSVIEVFNHHRETAYVGASIAGAGKTVVGKCPRCGKDVIKTGSIYACSSIKNEKQEDGTWKEVAGCGFKLFGFCTKKFTEKQAASLLDGKAVSLRGCKSKAGKTFDCTVVLQKDGSVEPIFTPRKPTKKGRR